MANDPNEQTTRIVASIADSVRVDWDEMTRSGSVSSNELKALRALETIRRLQAGELLAPAEDVESHAPAAQSRPPIPAPTANELGPRASASSSTRFRWLAFAILAGAGALLWAWSPWKPETPLTLGAQWFVQRDASNVLLDPNGARVGDRVFLDLRPSHPVYAYVFSSDDRGATRLLFPLPESRFKNPLSPGAPIRIPGSLDPGTWQVASPGETFWVVGSREPIAEAERLLSEIPAGTAGKRSEVEMSREQGQVVESLRRLRGPVLTLLRTGLQR